MRSTSGTGPYGRRKEDGNSVDSAASSLQITQGVEEALQASSTNFAVLSCL